MSEKGACRWEGALAQSTTKPSCKLHRELDGHGNINRCEAVQRRRWLRTARIVARCIACANPPAATAAIAATQATEATATAAMAEP